MAALGPERISLRAYRAGGRVRPGGWKDRVAFNSIAGAAILVDGLEQPEEQEHRVARARISKGGAKRPSGQPLLQQLQNSKV